MANESSRASRIKGEKLKPYALATGQMNLAWNDLHEQLGHLFDEAIKPDPSNPSRMQTHAIWGAISNDRQKRLVLDAAINWLGGPRHLLHPKAATDVLYITERANSLEDRRNNVIHSPLAEAQDIVAALLGQTPGAIYPGGLMNDRATKLGNATHKSGKDLLNEIILYRDYAIKLADFADQVRLAWRGYVKAWPERPDLPPLKDKGVNPAPRKPPKSPRRQPRSSRQ